MEDVLGEIGKGFLRGVGHLLAEVFFWTVCYWIGWPFCKIITGGRYPRRNETVYLDHQEHSGFWCAATGLVVVIALAIFLLGIFE